MALGVCVCGSLSFFCAVTFVSLASDLLLLEGLGWS